jgi:hypothetical protein
MSLAKGNEETKLTANRRVDLNQSIIVESLRRAGATVTILTQGKGLPDLLIGIPTHDGRAMNILVEVKNPLGRCDLTEAEQRWIEAWKGQIAICRTPEEALAVLDDIRTYNAAVQTKVA